MNKRKRTAQLVAFGKRNRFCKGLSIIGLACYLLIYYIRCYFKSNVKRYACVFVVCIFFFSSSSFMKADYLVADEEQENLEQTDQYVVSDITATNDMIDSATMSGAIQGNKEPEILEDNDVMTGYENTELEVVEDSERFTMDELIGTDEYDKYTVSDNDVSTATGISKDLWSLILINKYHSVPDDYEFPLGNINSSMQCDERIISDLFEMMTAAKNDGVNLVVCSPYRDINRQKVLFERKINAYMKQGMTYMEAYQISSKTVTVPGASEHQIGLAIDFLSDNYKNLNEGFADTRAGKWLSEHGCEYGFILRYPKGKEEITGIRFEPWHYRYVGKEAAMEITKQGITLEEFLIRLK